jgi:hypothetical protein
LTHWFVSIMLKIDQSRKVIPRNPFAVEVLKSTGTLHGSSHSKAWRGKLSPSCVKPTVVHDLHMAVSLQPSSGTFSSCISPKPILVDDLNVFFPSMPSWMGREEQKFRWILKNSPFHEDPMGVEKALTRSTKHPSIGRGHGGNPEPHSPGHLEQSSPYSCFRQPRNCFFRPETLFE